MTKVYCGNTTCTFNDRDKHNPMCRAMFLGFVYVKDNVLECSQYQERTNE